MADGMVQAGKGVAVRTTPEQAAEDDALCRRLGLAPGDLGPAARTAVRRLLTEIDHLRDELAASEARVRELERLADEDGLAPISNRRAFLRELMRAIRYAERYGIGGSLLYFDLNGLKAINDGFGHPAGDAVLLHVARLLLANVRASDLVGRLGGDEFGVLLVRADRAQAVQKAKALAELIERTPARYQDHAIAVGLAFGIHAFGPGEDVDSVLAAADRDMYRHKRSGRQDG